MMTPIIQQKPRNLLRKTTDSYFYNKVISYFPETNNLKYNNTTIFQFNSFGDMYYFWTFFIGCQFYKYSKNRSINFNFEELKEIRRKLIENSSKWIQERTTDLDEEEWLFNLFHESKSDYHSLIFPTNSGCVDLFFTKFDAFIVNELLLDFFHGYKLDPGESPTPEEFQNFMIEEFITYLENFRLQTRYNLPTYKFEPYIRQRTAYSSEFIGSFYFDNLSMMSIELSIFFPYKEDLIDLIECLRLAHDNFKKTPQLRWCADFTLDSELIQQFNQITDYYLPRLLESLSYQAAILPPIPENSLLGVKK